MPKISRQRRLPEAQPEQDEPDIPIEPKQSIVPKTQDLISKSSNENNTIIESDVKDQSVIEDLPQDTLFLEKAKEVIQDSLGIIKSNDNLNETEILPNSNLNTTPLDSTSAKGDEQSDEKL